MFVMCPPLSSSNHASSLPNCCEILSPHEVLSGGIWSQLPLTRAAQLCLFVITAIMIKVGGYGRCWCWVGYGIYFKGSLQQSGVVLL